MFDFLTHLFDTSDFPARWHCGTWPPGHGWLHILSDLAIWSADLAIPCVLGFFILRRKDIPFRTIFLLFGAFILSLQGHEVRVAHDGPAALEVVTNYRTEMVFLDIRMPGMDGYEVGRRLRRQPGLENIRLAALTGWGQKEDRRRMTEADFAHHLVKHVESKALDGVLPDLRSTGGAGQ
jgi:CheY-like chemotaxis protein